MQNDGDWPALSAGEFAAHALRVGGGRLAVEGAEERAGHDGDAVDGGDRARDPLVQRAHDELEHLGVLVVAQHAEGAVGPAAAGSLVEVVEHAQDDAARLRLRDLLAQEGDRRSLLVGCEAQGMHREDV